MDTRRAWRDDLFRFEWLSHHMVAAEGKRQTRAHLDFEFLCEARAAYFPCLLLLLATSHCAPAINGQENFMAARRQRAFFT